MEETKMQKVEEVHEVQHQHVNVEEAAKSMQQYGGFEAIKGFIPAAADMNPAKPAMKNIFLKENRNAAKRRQLAEELNAWLEVLNEDKSTASEYVDLCKKKEEADQKLLSQNITTALERTKVLETSYRSLNAFFLNANDTKLNKLRLVNTNKSSFTDEGENAVLLDQIREKLKDAYDRLSLRDSYSLLVIPGGLGLRETGEVDNDRLRQWAELAKQYKVLLVTDHDRESTFDNLLENTSDYKASDVALRNVVMTGNWIVSRKKEELSDLERELGDFMIPASAALAGKMYDENANMAQGASGERFGTLAGAKGVEIDLLKSEIEALFANNIVPIVYSEGRVMAFDNSTLYDGDNKFMKEYPIVRVFEWLQKVMMNFIHKVVGEIWDTKKSLELKKKIEDFLSMYQGYGKLFKSFNVDKPYRDEKTGRTYVNVSIDPYFAAKNFMIKLSAVKETSGDESSVE